MTAPVTACIGLGANLGDAAGTLRAAFAAIGALPETVLVAASPLYVTPAWGVEDQPDFVNAAARVTTTLPAPALLAALLEIERRFGRDRSREQRWGPRTLDLDLLLYGEAVIDVPGLQVPHPRLHERAFALVPLADVAPELRIAGHGSVREAAFRIDRGAITAL
ncbi:2-amino-4-hydroxy-6-hydroxymethyldihydropteridine diphosphokinase [Pseudoxanthomonas winnipegensis]|uniref:2-amino-4-hydroxy-6- hydroxymethyldihydropteridine diphosphokinase n=1 Tax=Pseudoxanthomonas winnipegensis TaxID=2480810 RepID=UPI0025778530|nr:2-amino-4-hydroxy-6-hydroxymethyldihydropteridine diphosphokinase [Pseudoxanthomonas winnipegensis]WJI17127.1 2-amino-4-hydroxy-6-hydroxymethyldihydropteridine diphosphokinase [Pseudoxanthomonas winnipegensis]